MGATILIFLKVRCRSENTTSLNEAPKTELGQVAGGPQVLGLQEHLPHHSAFQLHSAHLGAR